MAKLKLERPYFFSKERGRFGKVLSDDSRRIVYEIVSSKKRYVKGPHNRPLTVFYELYPDVQFLTEKEYLFETLKNG